MRFRARVSREGIHLLLSVFTTMSHISSEALILLEPNCFRVSVLSEAIENPRAYLEILAEEFFSEFRVESQSENRIAFEINFGLFIQALSSGKTASQAVLKLSKRSDTQQPCLAVLLDSQDSVYAVNVVHEVPIKLLKVVDVLPLVSQPDIAPPRVALSLPRKKLLKTVVERLGKLGKVVRLVAQQEGKLRLTVETAHVHVNTYLSALRPRVIGTLHPQESLGNTADVAVSVKKLVCLLDYHNIAHLEASLCISPGEALVLFLELQPARLGALTFYLPVLIEEDEAFAQPQANDTRDDRTEQTEGREAQERQDDNRRERIVDQGHRRKRLLSESDDE